MTRVQLAVHARAEGEQRIVATARGQVVHPVNLPAIVEGLRAKNNGQRRRSERKLLRAMRRGVVRRTGADQ